MSKLPYILEVCKLIQIVSGGNDSAVPPSPQSLLSRPSPAADQMDDLSENMLFGDDEAEPTESRDDRQKQRRPRAQRVPRTGDSDSESDGK